MNFICSKNVVRLFCNIVSASSRPLQSGFAVMVVYENALSQYRVKLIKNHILLCLEFSSNLELLSVQVLVRSVGMCTSGNFAQSEFN